MSRKPLSPAAEARKRFPGADPPKRYLREAFLAIVAARDVSRVAATHLEELCNIAYMDPEELEDSLEGWTIVEGGMDEAAAESERTRRICRLAIAALRRTRRRRPKARKLEIVT